MVFHSSIDIRMFSKFKLTKNYSISCLGLNIITIRTLSRVSNKIRVNFGTGEIFALFICYNVEIALSKSVIKIRGTGFSTRALLNL